jgi:hypothetical protein
LPFAREFIDFDAAEMDFEQRVRADPTIVGRVLTDVEGRGMVAQRRRRVRSPAAQRRRYCL